MDSRRQQDTYRLTRRRWLEAAAATAGGLAMAGGLTGCSARATDAQDDDASGPRADLRLRLLGTATLPYHMQFKGSTVGGLSGLDHDADSGLWWALSDDVPAHFYTLRIALSAGGIDEPELLDVIAMKQTNGAPYPRYGFGRLAADPEAIRYRSATRTLLWTSEGDRWRRIAPFVREMTLDGRHLRNFPLPDHFRIDLEHETGPRHNGAFEGLALTPDGGGAWVAMEHPLLQDEAAAADASDARSHGGPVGACRFTLFDLDSGRALRQIAYRPERSPRIRLPGFAFADNGVSEILMLDAHRMLVFERGLSIPKGLTLRLFVIDVRQPGDTLALFSLRGATSIDPARKTLVADFASLGLPRLDNTEGMAWGPRLARTDGAPGGQRTLVFVSDDNFSPLQITQFAAFAVDEV